MICSKHAVDEFVSFRSIVDTSHVPRVSHVACLEIAYKNSLYACVRACVWLPVPWLHVK